MKTAKVPDLKGERRLKADAWFSAADFGCEVTDTQGWEWDGSDTIKRTIHVINPESESTEHGTREVTVTFEEDSEEIISATFEGMAVHIPGQAEDDKENRFQVIMQSSDFGEDTYDYDTIEEARAGYNRLKKEIKKHQKKDKVQRTLTMSQILLEETIG